MLTSDCVGLATAVLAVAVLFAELGSPTVLLTTGEFVMVVPEGVAGFTFTTIEKREEAPEAMVVLRVQVKVPVPPKAMVLHAQFAGGVKETRVVLAGIVSVK